MSTDVTGKSATSTDQGLKYIIERTPIGWTSRVDSSSVGELPIESPPSEGFKQAMEVCCERFYPEIREEDRPWNQHGKETKETLEKKAQERWPLGWYWKILITHLLPEWLQQPNSPKVYIRLSQVRRWVMLTVSKEASGDARDKKRVLMRAPIFGRSDRIADWDQYWFYLLHSAQIEAEWERVKEHLHPIEKAYVLGRHDVEYQLTPSSVKLLDDRKIAVTILGKLDLKPYQSTPCSKNWKGGWEGKTWVPGDKCAPDPYDLVRFPVFDNISTKNRKDREASVLLASDHFCKALALLSDVWNDPTIRMIHLNAPPGSGKEVLAETIYNCREFKGRREILALSPHDTEQNELALFGRPINLTKSMPRLRYTVVEEKEMGYHDYEPGFIEQAENGVLILDEIDKVKEQTRTSLLRLLENSQFTVPGTFHQKKMKGREPLYVFLTSKPLDEVYESSPPDFWTRIPFTIEMQDPFDIHDLQEKQRALQQYLWHFWKLHMGKFFNELSLIMEQPSKGQGSLQRGRWKALDSYYIEARSLFESETFTDLVISSLAREIVARYNKISVRHLRSIIERCLFKFVEWIIYSRRLEHAGGRGDGKQPRKALETLEEYMQSGDYGAISPNSELGMLIETIAKSALERRVDYPG